MLAARSTARGEVLQHFISFFIFIFTFNGVRSCLLLGAQQEGKCCNIPLVLLCHLLNHVIYMYSDFHFFQPFSSRQYNTREDITVHQPPSIILTAPKKKIQTRLKRQRSKRVASPRLLLLYSRWTFHHFGNSLDAHRH